MADWDALCAELDEFMTNDDVREEIQKGPLDLREQKTQFETKRLWTIVRNLSRNRDPEDHRDIP